MAVDDNSVAIENSKIEEKNGAESAARVKGPRIYDPENGKSCHQCRQKTKDYAPSCKGVKRGKPCPLTYCPKCLLNRYGEISEEVAKLDEWMCPKCRDVCNCSCCMKLKGFQPTGILTHTAKANGYNSVLELLHNKGADVLEHRNVTSSASPRKSPPSIKDSAASKRTRDEENQSNDERLLKKSKKKVAKKLKIKDHNESKEDIVLPLGKPLTEIAGVELPAQDVGAVLQFLEFCNAFSEVLDIKIGQPECILRDLIKGRLKRHGVHPTIVEFKIKLLSLIKRNMEKEGDAWLKTLRRCIEESQCTWDEVPMDFFNNGSSGYDNLESSEKLKILNFLCDEVLGSEKLRNWIDEMAAKFDEERKENNERIVAAKRKEKLLRQKAKDEKSKAILSATEGTSPSLPESEDLISQLKTEADTAHAEVVASLELAAKKNQRSDAVRTDHVILGSNGHRFWKLSCYNNNSNILLQDIRDLDSATLQDKWFFYDEDEEKVVEKYISLLRNTKHRWQPSEEVEEETKSDSSDSSGLKDCLPQVHGELEEETKPNPSDSPGPTDCLPQVRDGVEEEESESNSSNTPASDDCLPQVQVAVKWDLNC